MQALDLFSGIGGFALGLHWAGMETVQFVERDPFCQKVLAKHWPGVPIYDDIKTFDARPFRGIDILTGGFPCQPWSDAGVKGGAEDDRDLWPEMGRCIEESQPRWIIGENVSGFVNALMGLDRTVSDLERLGYSIRTHCIPACAVGAPHQRMRAWIVAHRSRDVRRQPSQTGAERQRAGQGDQPPGAGGPAANASGGGSQGCHQPQRDDGAAAKRWSIHPGRVCTGDDIGWPTEPPVCRADDGVPRRVDRLRGLGNAVVPQIPYQIAKAIIGAEQK